MSDRRSLVDVRRTISTRRAWEDKPAGNLWALRLEDRPEINLEKAGPGTIHGSVGEEIVQRTTSEQRAPGDRPADNLCLSGPGERPGQSLSDGPGEIVQ